MEALLRSASEPAGAAEAGLEAHLPGQGLPPELGLGESDQAKLAISMPAFERSREMKCTEPYMKGLVVPVRINDKWQFHLCRTYASRTFQPRFKKNPPPYACPISAPGLPFIPVNGLLASIETLMTPLGPYWIILCSSLPFRCYHSCFFQTMPPQSMTLSAPTLTGKLELVQASSGLLSLHIRSYPTLPISIGVLWGILRPLTLIRQILHVSRTSLRSDAERRPDGIGNGCKGRALS